MGGRDQQQGQDFPRHPARLPGEAVEGGYVEQHERWLSVAQMVGGGFPRPSDSRGFSRCLSTCGGQESVSFATYAAATPTVKMLAVRKYRYSIPGFQMT